MPEKLYFEDVELGDDIGPVTRTVNAEQVLRFLRIRETDTGPNRFTSQEAAKAMGLPGAIVPGAMNIAMMSQLLTGWSPSVMLRKIDVVFRGMVPHDKPLRFSGIVTDKEIVDGEAQVLCDVFLENEEGVKLVIGNATLLLPIRESSPA
jgi:acyl dehydratase